jgi:hypothetical protein
MKSACSVLLLCILSFVFSQNAAGRKDLGYSYETTSSHPTVPKGKKIASMSSLAYGSHTPIYSGTRSQKTLPNITKVPKTGGKVPTHGISPTQSQKVSESHKSIKDKRESPNARSISNAKQEDVSESHKSIKNRWESANARDISNAKQENVSK